MVIEKGGDWGEKVEIASAVRADSDAAVVTLQRQGAPFATSGNLHRSLGAPSFRSAGPFTQLPIDALVCEVTGPGGVREMVACSDVTVGSWFSRRGMVIVTNVGIRDGLDVTPGSHPNDGKFEILAMDASMSVRQRLLARRRARTGSHLPHPCLTRMTRTEASIERRGAQRLFVDSVDVGAWESVRVRIDPDRLRVLV